MFEYRISNIGIQQTKTSRPQMGREEDSRGTTQVPRQKAGRFVLTNISLPSNAGIAVWTTLCFTQTAREGTSTGFGWMQLSAFLLHFSVSFRQPTFLCHCLLFN